MRKRQVRPPRKAMGAGKTAAKAIDEYIQSK